MEYRAQKKLGVEPSLLGFGCMRFPTLEGGDRRGTGYGHAGPGPRGRRQLF